MFGEENGLEETEATELSLGLADSIAQEICRNRTV